MKERKERRPLAPHNKQTFRSKIPLIVPIMDEQKLPAIQILMELIPIFGKLGLIVCIHLFITKQNDKLYKCGPSFIQGPRQNFYTFEGAVCRLLLLTTVSEVF